jgi:hypothetical protein
VTRTHLALVFAIGAAACSSKRDAPDEGGLGPVDPREQAATPSSHPLPMTMLAVPGTLRVSRDGRVAAYVVRKPGEGDYLMIGGKPHAVYEGVDPDSIVMSDDGAHVAYAVLGPTGARVVRDGVASPVYDGIVRTSVALSADGARLAYGFTRGQARFIIVDGKEYGPYDDILESSTRFGPGGKRVAWGARRGDRWFMVVDGNEDQAFAGLLGTGARFSPDGTRVMYGAMPATGGSVIVVDGEIQVRAAGIWEQGPVWSPDGAHVGVGVQLDATTWAAVVDGKQIATHPYVLDVAFLAGGAVIYGAATETRQFVIAPGGKPQPEYDGLAGLVVAANSTRWAYTARTGATWRVVVDGVEHAAYDEIGEDTPVFSPDGKHVAYIARQGARWVLVLDGAVVDQAAGFLQRSVAFAADGTLGYALVDDQRHITVVVGADRLAGLDVAVFGPDGLRLDARGTASFVAGRGYELYQATLPSR